MWRNVTVCRATGVNTGESSVKSPSIGRSGANAAFGAVSEYAIVVVKSLPPVVVDVVQPSGSDGIGASSKFSPGGNVPVAPLVTLSDAFAGSAFVPTSVDERAGRDRGRVEAGRGCGHVDGDRARAAAWNRGAARERDRAAARRDVAVRAGRCRVRRGRDDDAIGQRVDEVGRQRRIPGLALVAERDRQRARAVGDDGVRDERRLQARRQRTGRTKLEVVDQLAVAVLGVERDLADRGRADHAEECRHVARRALRHDGRAERIAVLVEHFDVDRIRAEAAIDFRGGRRDRRRERRRSLHRRSRSHRPRASPGPRRGIRSEK